MRYSVKYYRAHPELKIYMREAARVSPETIAADITNTLDWQRGLYKGIGRPRIHETSTIKNIRELFVAKVPAKMIAYNLKIPLRTVYYYINKMSDDINKGGIRKCRTR